MVDTLEKLNKKFNDKFKYLKLLSVVYDKTNLLCTITFLYPYTIDEIPQEDKDGIFDFYKDLLDLKGQLKIKYKKSFLDGKLVIKEISNFFQNNKKGIFPYLNSENITSNYKDNDVFVSIKLNQDILSMIDELELKTSLKKYLESQFIANFEISILENEETLPDEINFDDIPLSSTPATRRYQVNVEKILIGGEIMAKPEFIKDNHSPKTSVILCGFLSHKNQKKYTLKKGKNKGKEKSLYTFTLTDHEGGYIDCVYFCPKVYEKILESLDEESMILCLGDLKLGLNGKLTYYIKRISLANKIEQIVSAQQSEEYVHKKVVFPESIPRNNQINLFDVKASYNDFIMKNKIVVFDLETTGLNPEICEITEIGAVKIENGEITERFSSFAKPKFPIPEEVQQITHITDEMVKFAPRIEDVIYDFYEWSRDCIISGYNIVGFDLKFIQKEASKLGLQFDNTVIDTYIVARQSKIKTGNYKLGNVVKSLGITLVDAHRAYNDAYATAQVLMALNKAK